MTATAYLDPGCAAAYRLMAELLDYPGPDTAPRLARLTAEPAVMPLASPGIASLLAEFALRAAALPAGLLEELYTQTFDLQPQCTLNLGHHLFGEDWKRSALLIELKSVFDRHQVSTGTELPAHLCWLLRLLAQAPADAELHELAAACVRPAVHGLQQQLAKDNPYAGLLQALELLLAETAAEAIQGAAAAGEEEARP